MVQRSSAQPVGRPLLDHLGIGVRDHVGAAVLADVLGVMADQPVALADRTVLDLAGGGELEALLDAALGLELGHFRLLGCDTTDRPWQPGCPYPGGVNRFPG